MKCLIKPFFLTLVTLLVTTSCEKDDPQLPDNLISFASDEVGLAADETEISITLSFGRAITTEATISLLVSPSALVYDTDFTTDPATSGSSIAIVAAAGTTSATFSLLKKPGVLYDGDEYVVFTLQSVDGELVPGEKTVLTIRFAEILATSGSMELLGGGALYPNKVFVDLSGNRQTAVERIAWDLGFSSETDYRVIINSSNGAMVRQLNKTDLNTVTAADTAGWGQQLSMSAVFAAITQPSPPAWVANAITWIDDPAGDLTKTAMSAISATPSDNKVYIINRGNGPGNPAPGLGWKKIRIIRSGDNYTLQYADIAATSFTESTIPKNPDFRFNYFHFGAGAVSVEPNKSRWDIAWTAFSNSTNFGSGPVPYYFQDVILQNIQGVQTAKVLTSAIAYDAFAEADLAGLTFSSSQIGIGSDWRSSGGPGGPPALRTDRYYIVKDVFDNYYKLRFTALTTAGERGKPQLEFALVKKGT